MILYDHYPTSTTYCTIRWFVDLRTATDNFSKSICGSSSSGCVDESHEYMIYESVILQLPSSSVSLILVVAAACSSDRIAMVQHPRGPGHVVAPLPKLYQQCNSMGGPSSMLQARKYLSSNDLALSSLALFSLYRLWQQQVCHWCCIHELFALRRSSGRQRALSAASVGVPRRSIQRAGCVLTVERLARCTWGHCRC